MDTKDDNANAFVKVNINLDDDHPAKKDPIEATGPASKNRFVECLRFLIFDIRWIQVIFHFSLIAAFAYSSVTSIYIVFIKYFLQIESLPRVLSWTFGELIIIFFY